jgi:hypothetical protein
MFIRTKNQNGRRYHYLVENYRDQGKHCQRVLAYLGPYPTIEAAIADLPKQIERYRKLGELWFGWIAKSPGRKTDYFHARRRFRMVNRLEAKLAKLLELQKERSRAEGHA